MRKTTTLTGLLVLLAVGAALATVPDTAEVASPPANTEALKLRTTEVQLALAEQRAARAVLEAEYRAATDETVALAVQQRMADLARKTEWRILGIQAAYLRTVGQDAEAQSIEDAVKKMQAPPEKRVPVDRPQPKSNTGRSRP